MTPELLHLYKELYKTRAYFYRNKKQPGLHLIVINKPEISLIYEFGVPEVRRQLLLYLFGSENLQRALPETGLLLHQLPVIQYRGKKSSGTLPEVQLPFRVLRL
jgi:hypothetical protein